MGLKMVIDDCRLGRYGIPSAHGFPTRSQIISGAIIMVLHQKKSQCCFYTATWSETGVQDNASVEPSESHRISQPHLSRDKLFSPMILLHSSLTALG